MEGALAWNAVVSTKHAGIPDMLPPDAEDRGFLVAEGDVEGLAQAFRTLAADDTARAEWARQCALFARDRFDPLRFLRELVELLETDARVPGTGTADPRPGRNSAEPGAGAAPPPGPIRS
jgi:glycosyltransferase involved in cell wall biosynthesis